MADGESGSNMLSMNVPNAITVGIMAVVVFGIIALVARLVGAKLAKGDE